MQTIRDAAIVLLVLTAVAAIRVEPVDTSTELSADLSLSGVGPLPGSPPRVQAAAPAGLKSTTMRQPSEEPSLISAPAPDPLPEKVAPAERRACTTRPTAVPTRFERPTLRAVSEVQGDELQTWDLEHQAGLEDEILQLQGDVAWVVQVLVPDVTELEHRRAEEAHHDKETMSIDVDLMEQRLRTRLEPLIQLHERVESLSQRVETPAAATRDSTCGEALAKRLTGA